jgi:large subunit ribosomal protein L6
MSRIGRAPVDIPKGVTIEVTGNVIKVTGPKGALEQEYDPAFKVAVADGEFTVARPNDKPATRAKHGLVRALVNNMVKGVTEGFSKTLEIQGVGYRAAMEGKNLTLSVGFSHPVKITPPNGITFAVDGTTTITVTGIDKQQVGQAAADVRAWKKPEPYKGKGIRYKGEYVRRKVGKAGAK